MIFYNNKKIVTEEDKLTSVTMIVTTQHPQGMSWSIGLVNNL